MPVELPDWNEVFRDPTLPLMVDIGSGTQRLQIYSIARMTLLGLWITIYESIFAIAFLRFLLVAILLGIVFFCIVGVSLHNFSFVSKLKTGGE